MLRYRRLQIFVAAALAFVLVVGLAGGTLTPRHEIFPFASWFLFSLVPGRRSEFDLILHATATRRWSRAVPSTRRTASCTIPIPSWPTRSSRNSATPSKRHRRRPPARRCGGRSSWNSSRP